MWTHSPLETAEAFIEGLNLWFSWFDSHLIFFVLAFLGILFYTLRRDDAILKNGIKVDATISHFEAINHNEPGDRETSYEYCVTYNTPSDQTVEARLMNVRRFPLVRELPVGTRVRVKYLVGKEKYVLRVEE